MRAEGTLVDYDRARVRAALDALSDWRSERLVAEEVRNAVRRVPAVDVRIVDDLEKRRVIACGGFLAQWSRTNQGAVRLSVVLRPEIPAVVLPEARRAPCRHHR